MAKKTNPTDAVIGGNVRRLRLVNSLSQEKLGDAIGLTFQQVQKYEKGTNRIGGSRLVQIAAVLKVKPEALLEGTSTAAVANQALIDPVRAMSVSPIGLRIAQLWPKLSYRMQHALIATAEAFIAEADTSMTSRGRKGVAKAVRVRQPAMAE